MPPQESLKSRSEIAENVYFSVFLHFQNLSKKGNQVIRKGAFSLNL